MGNDATLKVDNQDPLIGTLIDGKYLIREKIGGGGMGMVYKAEHTFMNRVVAIKILRSDLASGDQEELLKRFEKEAQLASKLSHPNAITIYDFGRHRDRLYLVMQYLEGTSLKDILSLSQPLPLDRVLRLTKEICAGLSEAHAMGIVHRDLKPDNVMIVKTREQGEKVIVLDFGIAKLTESADEKSTQLTQTGKIIGTPKYMSPEQIRGRELDARSDVYSLGLVVYEMLSGTPAFEADSAMDLLLKHVSVEPKPFAELNPKLSIPQSVEAVVLKSLAKSPDARFSSVAEFALEFERAVSSSLALQTEQFSQHFDTGARPRNHVSTIESANPATRSDESRTFPLRRVFLGTALIACIVTFLATRLYNNQSPPVIDSRPEQAPAPVTKTIPVVTLPPNPTSVTEVPQREGTPPSVVVSQPAISPPATVRETISTAEPPAASAATAPSEIAVSGFQSPPPGRQGDRRRGESTAASLAPAPSRQSPPQRPPPRRASPAIDGLLRKADELAAQRNFVGAAALLEKELANYPNNYELNLALGSYTGYAGNFQKARNIFMDLITRFPRRGGAAYNLACLYALNGYKVKALSYLQTAITLEPRYRSFAAQDGDFNSLRADPGFNNLIGGSR